MIHMTTKKIKFFHEKLIIYTITIISVNISVFYDHELYDKINKMLVLILRFNV